MPNHIINTLKTSNKVLNALKSKSSEVDFNRVIPLSKDLEVNPHAGVTGLAEFVCNKTHGNELIDGLSMSNTMRDIRNGGVTRFSDDEFNDFIKCLRNVRKYGYVNWYEANIAEWGTKWGAYDIEPGEGLVRFQTAWSAPKPVIEKLAEMYPGERIEHIWADEDIGSNLGHVVYEGGVVTVLETGDRVDFACRAWGRDPAEYRSEIEECEPEETTAP